ncbi:helix-turn-helix domain-containing protein [Amedibacillus sp. YH-ame6]
MVDLNEVLTFSEAAEKWGFSDGNTLRKAVERNKFEAHELRKSGNVWLTTYKAMIRVFGQPANIVYTIYYADIIKIAAQYKNEDFNFQKDTQVMYEQAISTMRNGGQVAIVESKQHPHLIARIFTNKDELEEWFHYLFKRLKSKRKNRV